MDKLSEEFATLKDSLNETTLPVTSSSEMERQWSDLFKNNVDLVENVKCAQKAVVDTSANLNVNLDRTLIKNNLIFYNLPEDEKDTKTKDKEFLTELMKFFGLDFEFQKDVPSFARMGRRQIEDSKK